MELSKFLQILTRIAYAPGIGLPCPIQTSNNKTEHVLFERCCRISLNLEFAIRFRNLLCPTIL